MALLLPDGTRQITLSEDQFREINVVLRELYQKTRCPAVILCDMSGQLIARSGTMEASNLTLISTLAAANYAATSAISKLVGEHEGFKVHFHEGETNNIYIAGLGEEHFLVIVFARTTTFGMVRVLVNQSTEKLLEIVARLVPDAPGSHASDMMKSHLQNQEFQEELSSRLDSLFTKA